MGIRNVFLPSLATASSLYWMPPTGPMEASGLMVPVNATSDFISWPRTPETNDAVIRPPALGPSMKPFVSHEMRKLLMSLPVSNAPTDVAIHAAARHIGPSCPTSVSKKPMRNSCSRTPGWIVTVNGCKLPCGRPLSSVKKAAAFIVRLTVAGVGDGAGLGGGAGAAATACVGATAGAAAAVGGASAGTAVGATGAGAAQALANSAAASAGHSSLRAVHNMIEFPPATRAGFYAS